MNFTAKQILNKVYGLFGFKPRFVPSTFHDSNGREIRPEMMRDGQRIVGWTSAHYDFLSPERITPKSPQDPMAGFDFAIRCESPGGFLVQHDGDKMPVLNTINLLLAAALVASFNPYSP